VTKKAEQPDASAKGLPKGTIAATKSHHRDLDDPATVDTIMGFIAEGEKTLNQIAKFIGVPSRRLHAWVASNPEIEKRFLMAVNVAKADLIAEIRHDLREIAKFDIADCIDPLTGRMLQIQDLPVTARRAVQKYKETTLLNGSVRREIEMYNAIQARELLWKEAGALREQHDVNFNPYTAVQVPVTTRLPDPDQAALPAPAVTAEFV
jgi:hypothetical protein